MRQVIENKPGYKEKQKDFIEKKSVYFQKKL